MKKYKDERITQLMYSEHLNQTQDYVMLNGL